MEIAAASSTMPLRPMPLPILQVVEVAVEGGVVNEHLRMADAGNSQVVKYFFLCKCKFLVEDSILSYLLYYCTDLAVLLYFMSTIQ